MIKPSDDDIEFMNGKNMKTLMTLLITLAASTAMAGPLFTNSDINTGGALLLEVNNCIDHPTQKDIDDCDSKVASAASKLESKGFTVLTEQKCKSNGTYCGTGVPGTGAATVYGQIRFVH